MSDTINLFGITINKLSRKQVVTELSGRLDEYLDKPLLVVTPNVDHAIRYQNSAEFRSAYQKASYVLADGKPIVWASRFISTPLPETVTGSDLVPNLFQHLNSTGRASRVFLLGAMPGVAEQAKAIIEQEWPEISISGFYSPPFGFENDPEEEAKIISLVNEAEAEILVVGLGSPKQEQWTAKHLDNINCRLLLCVGATIDFLAGTKTRAPLLMQKFGLEWLYRALQEPRRLGLRYIDNLLKFPWLLLKELIHK